MRHKEARGASRRGKERAFGRRDSSMSLSFSFSDAIGKASSKQRRSIERRAVRSRAPSLSTHVVLRQLPLRMLEAYDRDLSPRGRERERACAHGRVSSKIFLNKRKLQRPEILRLCSNSNLGTGALALFLFLFFSSRNQPPSRFLLQLRAPSLLRRLRRDGRGSKGPRHCIEALQRRRRRLRGGGGRGKF